MPLRHQLLCTFAEPGHLCWQEQGLAYAASFQLVLLIYFLCRVLAASPSYLLPSRPRQVFVSIPACIDLLEGPYIETHEEVVKAFRPAALQRKQKPAACGPAAAAAAGQ